MTAIPSRRPGVTFLAAPPRPDEALPRMDVAAFVGLAESGPLDTPVPIEDVAGFRGLFGGDLPLAWNAERGRVESAHLAPAVESFFRNGGRRCSVVRVAGDAETVRFPLPGLVPATAQGGAPPYAEAEARARSDGGWAEALRAGTVLHRRTLPLVAGTPAVLEAGTQTWTVVVGAGAAEVRRGDLLELVFGEESRVLLLFVDRTTLGDRTARLEGATGFWLEADANGPLAWLAGTAGLAPAASRAAAGATGTPTAVRRLDFEILAWRGDELERRLGGLAFSPEHPRFWGRLPADDELFPTREGRETRTLQPEVEALVREAREPRFPFAGPAGVAGSGVLYLPFGMSSLPDPELARAAVGRGDATALERDGLADLGARVFLDPDLAGISTQALLAEAHHKHSVLQQRPRGIHSLLDVREATVLAVPDAVHRGFRRVTPTLPDPLPAPALELHEQDGPRLRLAWTGVGGADAYRLERAESFDFERPSVVYEGPETEAVAAVEDGGPRGVYFRVRALRGRQRSPFSAALTAVVPPADFDDCAPSPPVATELRAVATGPSSFRLEWTGDAAATEYELGEARDPDFPAGAVVYRGTATASGELRRGDGLYFYRVRARGAAGPGPWSEGVEVRLGAGETWVTTPPEEFDDGDLLAVHRAVLRFCAARGDLLAVLALPDSYREAEALDHVGTLVPGATGSGGTATAGVPPLTFGEQRVLAYGALYHPWVADAGRAPALAFSPPEGAVCGVLAALTIERGAWHAPANRPLRSALALTPQLGLDEEDRLLAAGVNLLRQDPRGFLTLGADTLAAEPDLRPIPVRRTLVLLGRLALREGARYVFEPHDADFRLLVRQRFERLLGDLFVRGALAGATPGEAFQVVADDTLNPPESVDQGRFVVELRVAPSRPLAFLTVRLVQSGPELLTVREV